MKEEYQEKLLKILEAISKNILAIATRMDIKQEIYDIQELEKKVPIKKPNAPKIEEEAIQDLKGVTLLHTTDSAILVFKNGYQKWIPKQYLPGYTIDIKKPQDLTLKEEGKWILKKPWEPYMPYKEGK